MPCPMALSYVLGTHHGVGCCITFDTLDEYYPDEGERISGHYGKNRGGYSQRADKDLTGDQMETMITVALGPGPFVGELPG